MTKTIAICSVGSRGDVQPYCALGCALKSKGHRVILCTEQRMQSLVESFGLQYGYIYGDKTGILFEPDMIKALENGNLFTMIRVTGQWEKKFNKVDLYSSYLTTLSGADLIISGGLCITESVCVAEKLQVPWISMILGPTVPTSQFPIWPLKSLLCGCSCLNKWSYYFLFRQLWNQERDDINKWRKSIRMDLPELKLKDGIFELLKDKMCLIACSRVFCPKQTIPSDYPSTVFMKGFIFVPPVVDEETQIDPRLLNFVKESEQHKEKIVYFGFGSMPCTDPSALVKLALDVCRDLSVKGVLLAGWTDIPSDLLSQYHDQLIVVPSAPHDWLFPRMACVVHHCGIGTSAAGLRAGVPCVPCPFMVDQFHNAEILVNLGVAPISLPFKKSITAKKLASAVGKIVAPDGTGERYYNAAASVKRVVNEESATALQEFVSLVELELK